MWPLTLSAAENRRKSKSSLGTGGIGADEADLSANVHPTSIVLSIVSIVSIIMNGAVYWKSRYLIASVQLSAQNKRLLGERENGHNTLEIMASSRDLSADSSAVLALITLILTT